MQKLEVVSLPKKPERGETAWSNIGVHLIFENNNIDTRTAFSEMLLTVLSAFAQEESRSISENTKWGIRKRFEAGDARWCNVYGYTRDESREYIPVSAEADVVRRIFTMYEHGSSIKQIVETLENEGVPSAAGKAWTASVVQKMLKNEKYVGDILLQKFLTVDHISHRAVRNSCTDIPAYYIENHHQPIVGRKTYDHVQEILKLRSNGAAAGRKGGRGIQYPLGNMLRCPICGKPLTQRMLRVTGERGSFWICEDGDFAIRSRIVESAILDAYRIVDAGGAFGGDDKGTGAAFDGDDKETGENAAKLAEMKKQNPEMERVDYYWVDDLISSIELGAHTSAGDGRNDRTLTVHWKAGMETTVPTEATGGREDPKHILKLYQRQQERLQGSDDVAENERLALECSEEMALAAGV